MNVNPEDYGAHWWEEPRISDKVHSPAIFLRSFGSDMPTLFRCRIPKVGDLRAPIGCFKKSSRVTVKSDRTIIHCQKGWVTVKKLTCQGTRMESEILNGDGGFVCSYATMQPVIVNMEHLTHTLGIIFSKAGPMGLKDLPYSHAPNLSFTFILT